MSESAILELSDPDTQGSFVVSEKTTTAVVNENINNDPQGTLFYVYAITRTVQDITLVSSIAETRIMQILRLSTETESSRVTIKEIEPDYEPLAITGSLNLSENTESKRIDVVIRTENTDDSYIYFGVVKKYQYDHYTPDVMQHIMDDPDFQGNVTSSDSFFIPEPLLLSEKVLGDKISKYYYFTVFVLSTTTGEYIRQISNVFYDALPLIFMDGFTTTGFAVHVDLRIDHLYPHYQYEYAGRVSELPLTGLVITDLFDNQESNIEGAFVQSETTTVATTKPDINQDPLGTLFYMYMFTRPVEDPDLVSLVADTRIIQVIQNDRFTVKEIDTDYVPLDTTTDTLTLAENKPLQQIDVSLNVDDFNNFVYFGTVRKYPYPSFDIDVVQDILANPDFQGSVEASAQSFAIANPLLIPEQVVGSNVTKDYYVTVFARSTTTGEYMRRSDVVFYDAIPLIFIDGFSTTGYDIHADLRIDHLYPHYQYEHAGRASEAPLTDIVMWTLAPSIG